MDKLNNIVEPVNGFNNNLIWDTIILFFINNFVSKPTRHQSFVFKSVVFLSTEGVCHFWPILLPIVATASQEGEKSWYFSGA